MSTSAFWYFTATAAKSLQSCLTLCDPIPWDSPGKNTGVGCHFLLQCIKVKSENEVSQSRPTLRDPMDCSLPGSSVHGIFQARVLEWGVWYFKHPSKAYPQWEDFLPVRGPPTGFLEVQYGSWCWYYRQKQWRAPAAGTIDIGGPGAPSVSKFSKCSPFFKCVELLIKKNLEPISLPTQQIECTKG